jgi:type IV pilus assembly protein PilE
MQRATRHCRSGATAGFTLIETMMTTLIFAILSSIAWASYGELLRRSHRGEARIALLRVHAAQERHYLDHLRYSGLLDAQPEAGGLGLVSTTPGGRYLLELTLADDGQHYAASAQPVPGSPQAADIACARLTINESGETSATAAECWP